ncbi:hypothetical protein DFP72DRAFT_1077225 [Ephemerocybe angulata]|uniref:Uncharacterized protein n=1 Tax=Ephemerocybe angulata TaxID=980116 RepID=A0A8H6HG77_9AGAR|nr:hypothetical protein DFP72DRAFT_1077225 [Tulosesus angulatus]
MFEDSTKYLDVTHPDYDITEDPRWIEDSQGGLFHDCETMRGFDEYITEQRRLRGELVQGTFSPLVEVYSPTDGALPEPLVDLEASHINEESPSKVTEAASQAESTKSSSEDPEITSSWSYACDGGGNAIMWNKGAVFRDFDAFCEARGWHDKFPPRNIPPGTDSEKEEHDLRELQMVMISIRRRKMLSTTIRKRSKEHKARMRKRMHWYYRSLEKKAYRGSERLYSEMLTAIKQQESEIQLSKVIIEQEKKRIRDSLAEIALEKEYFFNRACEMRKRQERMGSFFEAFGILS